MTGAESDEKNICEPQAILGCADTLRRVLHGLKRDAMTVGR